MTELNVKKLNKNNINDILTLQAEIVQNLPENQQHFICKKSEAEFLHILGSDEDFVLGIYDQDKLVAQSTAYLPKNGKKREMAEYEAHLENEDVAIYKTILVNPAYRKHGLMKKMLESFETLDAVKDRKTALIQIAIENPASWVNALKHGMKITQVAKDPEDDAMVIYLKKELGKSSQPMNLSKNTCSVKIDDNLLSHPHIMFNKMSKISETMIGASWDKETKSIIWHQKPENQEKTKLFIKEKSYAR